MKEYKKYVSPELEKIEYKKEEVLNDPIEESIPSGGGNIDDLI